MRAIYLLSIFLILVALTWSLEVPLASLAAVHGLAKRDADSAALEKSLARAGSGATLALRRGMNSDSLATRLHCARLLALRGDRSGDRCLLETLRNHSAAGDSLGAMAETLMLSVWDQRDGPSPALRDKLTRPRGKGGDAMALSALNDLLEKYPGWAAGYVQRAQIYQRNGDGQEAKRQALAALTLEPGEFEAIVVLAQAYLLLGSPEQAGYCLQQALTLNPRLKLALREDIRETLKAIDLERARRRRDQRKDIPLI